MKLRGFVFGLFIATFFIYLFFPGSVNALTFNSSMYGYEITGVQDGSKLDDRFIFADEGTSANSYRVKGDYTVSAFNGSLEVWQGMFYRNFYNSESDNFSMYTFAYLFNDGPVLDTSSNYTYTFKLIQNTGSKSSVAMSNFSNLMVFFRYSISGVDYSYVCTLGDTSDTWGATRNVECVIPGSANMNDYQIFFDFQNSMYLTSAQISFVVSYVPSYGVTDKTLVAQTDPEPENPNQGVEDAIGDLTDNILDDSLPDTSGYGDVAGWLPQGTIDSLVNLPFSLLNSINSNANKSCTPYQLPFLNNTVISIPCIGTYLESLQGWGILISSLDLCIACIFLYKLLMSLYKDVQRVLSLQVTDSDLGGIE